MYEPRYRSGRPLVSRLGLLAIGLTVCMAEAPVALACSPNTCGPATVFPAHGELPQNQLQLRLAPRRSVMGDAGVTAPHLYRVDGDRRTEIALSASALSDGSLLLVPAMAPEVSTKLVFEADESACAGTAPLHAEFVVTASAEVPTDLGSLQVALGRAEVAVPTSRGSCVIPLDAAFADLTLTPTPAAAPLLDVIERQLWVDGVNFAGATRVYGTCEPFIDSWANGVNLKLGKHRAELRGTTLGGAQLKTAEVEFELRCESDGGVSDAGARGDAGVSADAGTTLGGFTDGRALDAGATVARAGGDASISKDPVDAGPPGPASVDPHASADADDGCALATQRGSTAAYGAWLGVAVALLLARRRRT